MIQNIKIKIRYHISLTNLARYFKITIPSTRENVGNTEKHTLDSAA